MSQTLWLVFVISITRLLVGLPGLVGVGGWGLGVGGGGLAKPPAIPVPWPVPLSLIINKAPGH